MRKISWRAGLLIGLILLVYFPALRAGFVWDDEAYVLNNWTLRNLHGLWEIWFSPHDMVQYYPLTFTSLWINYQIGGLQPFGYHLVNVLLHSLNCFLLWRLLDRLKVPGAWFAALLFAIHPVEVESVAWVTERKNVLSGFFYFSSLLSFLRFKAEQKGLRPWYFVSFFCFLAALFSKTVTATLPATLLIILWWKDGKFSAKDFVRLIPFFASAAVLGAITMKFENHHMVSMGMAEWTFTFADRCLIAGRALWFYLGKLIWPHPLVFIYPRWDINPSVMWQWIFPISYGFLLLGLWAFRSKIGRGFFAGVVIFTVTLFPALGFKNFFPMRFSFVADHFQYLASIAPLTCAVAAVRTKLENTRVRNAIGIVLILACCWLSRRQTLIYKNLETLWLDTLAKNPSAWMAHNNLGAVYIESGRHRKAEIEFKESIRLKPDFADPYTNLGNIEATRKNYKKAAGYVRKAIRLQPNDADFHNNLGTVFYELGFPDKALPHYLKAIELDPKNAPAYFNMGNAFLKKGEIKKTVYWYRKAQEYKPDYIETYTNLGASLASLGRLDEAAKLYEDGIKINPKEAMLHNNLANIFGSNGRLEEAEQRYREAILLEPNTVLFHNNFASFLANQGKEDEAIKELNEVLRLDPKNPQAQRSMKRLAFDSFFQEEPGKSKTSN